MRSRMLLVAVAALWAVTVLTLGPAVVHHATSAFVVRPAVLPGSQAVGAGAQKASAASASLATARLRGPAAPATENSGGGLSCQVGLAACLCGLVAGLASAHARGSSPARGRRCEGLASLRGKATTVIAEEPPAARTKAVAADSAPAQQARTPPAADDGRRFGMGDVEDSVRNFVPKIRSLQAQAEALRSGELRSVIDSLQSLGKAELGSVFGEVDTMLGGLVESIQGLRASAVGLRQQELRTQFEEDSEASPSSSSSARVGSADPVDTMMEVHVVGLSHHRASVELREKLAVAQADWNAYARDLVEFGRTPGGYVVPEVAVLSTCNRFELYFVSSELKKYAAAECVHAFLRRRSGLTREELDPFLFTHSGEEAIQHLFGVSSGLDSLVLGEAQILAQVKACHEHCMRRAPKSSSSSSSSSAVAREVDVENKQEVPGSGGKILAKMLNAAVRTGKLVRTRTKIGKGSVSVSSAAVELMMSRALADLRKQAQDLHVCILGAGKMGRLLLIALFSKHPDIRVTLVNRSVDKAQALLEEVSNRGGARATVAGLEEQWDVVAKSDVVFAATSSTEPVLSASDLERLEPRRRMLVDISVPRNIAANCASVEGVASYSVDDLKKVVQENARKRQDEVLKAKRFINEEVERFRLWQASQGAVPYIASLQALAEEIRSRETSKVGRRLKGLHDKERKAVDTLTSRILNSLLAPIYYAMKEDEDIDAKKSKISALRDMFRLEPLYKRRLLPQG